MRRGIATVVIASISLIVFAAVPYSRVQGMLVSNKIAPFTETLTNPCNGETVDVSGQLHVVASETVSGSIIHLVEQVDVHAVGISTQGTRYVLNAANNLSAN